MTAVVNSSNFSIETNGTKINSSSAVAVIDDKSKPLSIDTVQQNEALRKLLTTVPGLSNEQNQTTQEHLPNSFDHRSDDNGSKIYIKTPLFAAVVRFAKEHELDKESHVQRLEKQRTAEKSTEREIA